MPRARKTQSGAPAMSTQQIAGQQYGKGVEQAALADAMPAPQAPQVASPLPVSGPASPSAAPPGAPAPRQPSPPVDPMAAAALMRNQIGLLRPDTTRPDEPVTHGLASGPGAGPEVMGVSVRSPLGDTLRNLARLTGDPALAAMADRANL